jgi:hypothetical protein
VLCFVDYRLSFLLAIELSMTRNCNQGAMYNGYSGRHDSTAWGCWMWRRFTDSLFAFDIICLICSGWVS